jgi:hypothetical protein
MVPVVSLWLPILLSSVFVFAVSSLIHMLLGYHNTDFSQLPKEDQILESLSKFDLPPGEYVLPWSNCGKDLGKAEFKAQLERGPAGFLTVFPRGPLTMGKSLALWFLYSAVVGIFAAYIAGRALGPGAPYLHVFRFAGCTAFAGYSLALLQNSIWYRRPWLSTTKSIFDGLVYALVTAGTFGWLWPA